MAARIGLNYQNNKSRETTLLPTQLLTMVKVCQKQPFCLPKVCIAFRTNS